MVIADAIWTRLPAFRAALLLLVGADRRVADHDGQWTGRAWFWLGLLGLAWGAVLAGTWELAWRAFPRGWLIGTNLPVMPPLAVLAVMLLSPLRRPLAALARAAPRRARADRPLLAATLVVLLALGLLDLGPWYRESISLPPWLAWTRPLQESRVLLLMPMWGAWAMMVPCHFCALSARACPLVQAHRKRQPVAATAVWMALPLAGTLWELNVLSGWVAVPAVLAMLAGTVGSILCCRLAGGMSLPALRAANAVAQLALLAGYLVAKSNT